MLATNLLNHGNEEQSFYYSEGYNDGLIEGRKQALEILLKQEQVKTQPISVKCVDFPNCPYKKESE
jgi:hypothetical protein